jgi:hypothetical protein
MMRIISEMSENIFDNSEEFKFAKFFLRLWRETMFMCLPEWFHIQNQ